MLLTGDAGQTRDPSPKPNACAGEMHTPEAAANQDDGGGGGGLARACARQVTFASPSAPPVIQEPENVTATAPPFSAALGEASPRIITYGHYQQQFAAGGEKGREKKKG